MNIYSSRPVVLCLSGHDPSGGAGLQADIEALLVQGCHAAPVVTALTVQNTVNVSDFRVLDREWVLAQANAVLSDSEVAAVKLGMLGSTAMVDTVVELLQAHPHLPVVCDPVLRAGGGGSLGKDEVGYAMRERLLPLSLIAIVYIGLVALVQEDMKKLVAALHTPEVKAFILEKYKGAIVPAF